MGKEKKKKKKKADQIQKKKIEDGKLKAKFKKLLQVEQGRPKPDGKRRWGKPLSISRKGKSTGVDK